TSAPFRGLDVLLDIFPAIRQAHPEAVLRVYASMGIYQLGEAADPFAPLYQRCRTTPGIEYIGAQPQAALARMLEPAAIFAYPSTLADTSSIAVLDVGAAVPQCVT